MDASRHPFPTPSSPRSHDPKPTAYENAAPSKDPTEYSLITWIVFTNKNSHTLPPASLHWDQQNKHLK